VALSSRSRCTFSAISPFTWDMWKRGKGTMKPAE
jgi:hypothetical protein